MLISPIIGTLISMDPFRLILQLKQTWQQLSSSANSHINITTISQSTKLLHHHHSNSHPSKATSIPAQVNSIPPLWTLGAQPCKAQPQSSLNFEPSLAAPPLQFDSTSPPLQFQITILHCKPRRTKPKQTPAMSSVSEPSINTGTISLGIPPYHHQRRQSTSSPAIEITTITAAAQP